MARRRERTARRPRISRRTSALTALVTALSVLYAILVPIQAALSGTHLALAFLLGAGLCAAPFIAIARPRRAVLLFTVSALLLPLTVVTDLATESPWPWSVPALLVFLLLVGVVAFLHGAKLGAASLALGVAASLAAPLIRPDMVARADSASSATANLIVTASVGAAVFLIALLLAGRMRVAEELTREKEHSALEESRRALVEERTRIARELHDVVAHTMSVIQVQSSTARYRLPGLDTAVAAEFDDIAATARTSLAEMRRMLGVLRTEDQSAELTPQQGIDDVPALVDSIRRAGVDVGLSVEGAAAATHASPAVQIASFRIIQEALSNAVRHAPGTGITVRLQADAAMIRLRVHNGSPSQVPEPSGTGYGLRGMRERAELLGGTFTAGPDSDGGWMVTAALPFSTDDAIPRGTSTDKETP
ncbi:MULTISPECIES: sensor histidine kinase [unclassified Microbacterium]|uniref:sensor histidine kinase n=1 Tax=unclassified Microbacterium TaxID=2609290 RepID=UPI000EA93338|nr:MULTISPECIES: sensor histidine kinase [unclassified Microbacterium]MBT2486114.1 sensor histidine kinase [Microbacterium sp. ISL-108]RKN68844.1 sensor histidine kinase [Microbacterium sp. CGR2]